MAAHDTSWDAFRAELKRWMDLRQLTNKELADALNAAHEEAGLTSPIDTQIVKRWRHSTSPPLQALKVIARALQMSDDPTGRAEHDPTYLPRIMGILDSSSDKGELINAAYRLQSLRTQIADAQGVLAAATADEGVITIVRAAIDTCLGCAVFPVHEGPAGYPMHVSDRIDLRTPVPGEQLDLTRYPQMLDALQDALAVRSGRTPRFCADGHQPVSQWAVRYLGRPRSRALSTAHRHVPAVAVNAVTTAGWVDDIGDVVAMVLGYGFTTTRALARELVADPYGHEELRGNIHDNFLFEATPQRRVWSHYSHAVPQGGPAAPFRDRSDRVSSELVQFFLVEDDALLRHAAHNPPGATESPAPEDAEAMWRDLVRTRDELRTRAIEASTSQRLFLLETSMRDTPEGRWTRVFECVLAILEQLAQLGLELELKDLHKRLIRTEPGVAPQVLRWLADHDAPFVSPTFRTPR